MRLLSEGAEAKIFIEKDKVRKERIEKKYRHREIDEKLRRRRTKHEAKILRRAKEAGVNVPEVFNLNKKLEPQEKYELEIEFLKGDKLAETLDSYNQTKQREVMQKLGEETAKIHKNDIIHGDLTTSNTILKEKTLYLIDFGLGYFSKKIEDKAVDLHLIKQALKAKHFKNEESLFEAFKAGYEWEESDKILQRLIAVEKRGRYKH